MSRVSVVRLVAMRGWPAMSQPTNTVNRENPPKRPHQTPHIDFSYFESPPTPWTFQHDSIRRYVEQHLQGRVLNLFAGKTRLRHGGEIITNDIDPGIDSDYQFDATEVRAYFEPCTFDTVILDPPYNVRKAREKYDGQHVGLFTRVKDQVAEIVRPGGKTLHFGYDSTGMSPSRGFEKTEICLINHKGDHNDTICVIERRTQTKLSEGWDHG